MLTLKYPISFLKYVPIFEKFPISICILVVYQFLFELALCLIKLKIPSRENQDGGLGQGHVKMDREAFNQIEAERTYFKKYGG